MNIGARIRYLLEEAGMTQRELANILHISASTLNGYIKQGKEPDFDMLIRLANYFNTTTDYLLGRANLRTSPDQPISTEEGRLLGIYRLLPPQQKEIVLENVMSHYRHVCNSDSSPLKKLQPTDQSQS